jgi:uncharacterized protein (TIGR02996 family)
MAGITLNKLTDYLKTTYPGLSVRLINTPNSVEIDNLDSNQTDRIGEITKAWHDIQDYAIKHQKTLVVKPGSLKNQLARTFKNLGFIPNRGRQIDFSLTSPFQPIMYWKPHKTTNLTKDAVPFIKRILGNIHDYTNMLVFADWLEDNGNPLSDLIRAVVERKYPSSKKSPLNKTINYLTPKILLPAGRFHPTNLQINLSAEEPPYCHLIGPATKNVNDKFRNAVAGKSGSYTYYPFNHEQRFTLTGVEHWQIVNIPANTLVFDPSRYHLDQPSPAEMDFPYFGLKIDPQPPEVFYATFLGLLHNMMPKHLRK